ncbi:hypothetical protein GEMRC1_000737 [Eukaryota sp. GEM-RC1]
MFFETNTFPIVFNDLSPLKSIAALFGADIRSIFLHVNGISEVNDYLSYSHIISGLEGTLRNHNDLACLNLNSSSFFSQLKHFCVRVDASIFLTLVEQLHRSTSPITKLNLEDISIGDAGAKSLAEALKVNTTLVELDVKGNGILDEGAIALAEALKVNSTLIEMDLGWNSIGNEGAFALAEALHLNSTISVLNLFDNAICDEGAIALTQSLRVNSSITELYLWYNHLSPDIEEYCYSVSNGRIKFTFPCLPA